MMLVLLLESEDDTESRFCELADQRHAVFKKGLQSEPYHATITH
jgi:hypothetical protein